MNELLTQLMGLLAALYAIVGAPVNANKMPDRPAIVQPAPGSVKGVAVVSNSNKSTTTSTKPADNSNSLPDSGSIRNRIQVSGVINSIKLTGGTTTIAVADQSIAIDGNTKVTGKLEVGAQARIEAIQQVSGILLATSVDVKKGADTINPPVIKIIDSQSPGDNSKKDGEKTDGDDSKKDDKSGTGGSGDDKSGSGSSGDDKSGSDSSGKGK